MSEPKHEEHNEPKTNPPGYEGGNDNPPPQPPPPRPTPGQG